MSTVAHYNTELITPVKRVTTLVPRFWIQKLSKYFRHRHLCRNSLVMFYNWFVISGSYYGLSLSVSDLGGNPYINFLVPML
jgi:hypothetical protein